MYLYLQHHQAHLVQQLSHWDLAHIFCKNTSSKHYTTKSLVY
ncbi:hypothetical protein GCWU000324_01426 [Kingella oralis ATCC 51147]|uniref:Uncharacterized protein n=1 Tax=Kingella oralis ATCC 51147 TaxID=629741 RepID=C4GH07_9NEIS|nr:hypothetical protein GCWU000324_01426 [Kingella oralis ATCC 51147]